MAESSDGSPGGEPALPRDGGEEAARQRPVLLYVLLAMALAFGAAMAVLHSVSRRHQGRVTRWLRSELDLAEKMRRALKGNLARERGLHKELEARVRQSGEVISSLREGGEEGRQRYTQSEHERREVARLAEEKTDELIQRHRRIVELQDQVERLVRKRSAAEEAAHARETELRHVYEAELRNERLRRRDLEGKLEALDEIRALREKLRRLADRMQELVQADAARGGAGTR